jgi:spore germination protein YaaH
VRFFISKEEGVQYTIYMLSITTRIIALLLAAVAGVAGVSGMTQGKVSVPAPESRVTQIVPPRTLTLHGWVPFWAKASGTKEVLAHAEAFSTVSPFSFEINPDGTLFDRFASDRELWAQLSASTTKSKIKVVPTIAWFGAEQIDATLSSSTARKAHIAMIVNAVKKNNYDGIDIDYEGKLLRTRDSYSLFIKELAGALSKEQKQLQCTVEARTPAEDRLWQLPRGMSHASDYSVLNKYCTTVRIMAYDQRDDDQTLVYENGDVFYRPVADNAWVEKTIKEAIYEIDRKKLVLGIPTYGNVYSAKKNGAHTTYTHIGALNYGDAVKRARQYKVTPLRNAAGELQFGYMKDNVQYYVTFTDAVAVKKKLLLAERFGLYGVAIFKIDGGMDQRIWTELAQFI